MAMQKDMMSRAVRDSFAKLDPRVQVQNPVMFLVWLSAAMTSILAIASIFGVQDADVPTYYVIAIAVILWLTDLFSNFAEALAEGRGKAQADSLRAAKKDVEAHRIESVEDKDRFTVVPGTELSHAGIWWSCAPASRFRETAMSSRVPPRLMSRPSPASLHLWFARLAVTVLPSLAALPCFPIGLW